MNNTLKIAGFVGLSFTIIVFVLLLLIPTFLMADLTFHTVPFVSDMIIQSEQYEPVISFKQKYPDYAKIIPEQPNPDNVRIIYQYQNTSLNKVESLSIIESKNDGIFVSLQCGESTKSGYGGKSFVLRYYTDGDVDEFHCADYDIDSDKLDRLHNAKESLEQSDIPIDSVRISYDTESLLITLFGSPSKINEKKINDILLDYNIPASVAYHDSMDSW